MNIFLIKRRNCRFSSAQCTRHDICKDYF